MEELLNNLATAGTNIGLLILAFRWIRKGGVIAKVAALTIFAAAGASVASIFSQGLAFAVIVALAAVVAIPAFILIVFPVAGSMLAASASSLRRDAAAAERERIALLNPEPHASR